MRLSFQVKRLDMTYALLGVARNVPGRFALCYNVTMNKLLDLLKRALHRRRRSYVETILAEKPVAFYRFDVDDVKVFKDRILTPEEVQEHYKIDP